MRVSRKDALPICVYLNRPAYWLEGSRSSAIGIATRQRAGWSGVRSQVGPRNFSLLRNHNPCDPPSILLSGYLCSFPGVKRPGCDVKHSPPSRAIPVIPPHAFMVWTVTSVFFSQLLNRLRNFPLLKNTDVNLEPFASQFDPSHACACKHADLSRFNYDIILPAILRVPVSTFPMRYSNKNGLVRYTSIYHSLSRYINIYFSRPRNVVPITSIVCNIVSAS
jgi:hypothetical protein